MMNVKINSFILLLSLLVFSCTKDEISDKTIKKNVILQAEYIYDLENISIYQEGLQKPNSKTLQEFASIAYTELFGTTIPAQKMTDLVISYVSFGDKKMIEDLMIRNFLQLPGVQIPTSIQMQADVDNFILQTYQRFYTRVPNEFEIWQLKEYINNNTSVTPELIYYAFMTSDEYRYY